MYGLKSTLTVRNKLNFTCLICSWSLLDLWQRFQAISTGFNIHRDTVKVDFSPYICLYFARRHDTTGSRSNTHRVWVSCGEINIFLRECVVYLITCSKCDNQYVGETKQKLSKRLSGHRSAIKKHANTFIAKHFNQPGHSVADILIQPIEKIELLPGESDEDVTIRRLGRERFWMLELGTVYPYGLNDRLQSVGNVSKNLKNNINVFSLLNKHKRRKRSHGRRRNKVSRSKLRWKIFIAFLTKSTAEVYIIC